MATIWRHFWAVIAVVSMLMFLVGASCSDRSTAATAPPTPQFDKNRAWNDLVAQVEFGPRVPGTEAHRRTRDWLVAQLQESATEVTLQAFTHPLRGKPVQMWNIIATIPGTGEAPREQVILAAHWDTRPTADKDPNPAKRLTPIDGANDGASGVAVLLEIARQLKTRPIERDIVIILFDGEDYGPQLDNMLLGSKYYASHLPDPKPDWGILLDMVGDKDLAIYREPNSDHYAREVNDRVFRAARELGYLRTAGLPGFVDAPFRGAITDDHIPLNEAGIPTVDLIDFDYPVWHTTADTVDQCSADSLAVVGKTVIYALHL